MILSDLDQYISLYANILLKKMINRVSHIGKYKIAPKLPTTKRRAVDA